MFYLNILLSVALFLTVLADPVALVSRQRDDRLVYVRSVADRLPASRSCCSPRRSSSRSSLLSLFLSPWAEQRKLEYERQLESRDEIALLTPGLFREFQRANLVVFVESINPFDGTIRNVFLHSVDDKQGRHDRRRAAAICEERRTATASSCWRTAGATKASRAPPTTAWSSSSKLGRRIEPAELRALPIVDQGDPDRRRCSSLDGRVERAELFWRISVPISALVLTLLAIPLAYVNPRMGRSFNLIAAAFLYMLYSNCLNIVQSLIAQGKLDFWVGLLVPHAHRAAASCSCCFAHQLSVTGLFGRRAARPPHPA